MKQSKNFNCFFFALKNDFKNEVFLSYLNSILYYSSQEKGSPLNCKIKTRKLCFWTAHLEKCFLKQIWKIILHKTNKGPFLLVFLLLYFSINMVGGFKKDPELTCLCTNLVIPILSWSCTLSKTE